MTTAEAALRQLLADVEAARLYVSRGKGGQHVGTGPVLSRYPPSLLAYLEKLARDGLAAPAREEPSHLMGCGGTLPYAGLDYIAAFFGCLLGGFVAVPAYPPDPSRLKRRRRCSTAILAKKACLPFD